MFLRNCWYAAGWTQDLPSEGTHARMMLDEPQTPEDRTPGARRSSRPLAAGPPAGQVHGRQDASREAQQQIIDRSPGHKMQATSHDAAPNQFRWVMDKLIAAEQADLKAPTAAHRTVMLASA